MGVWAYGRMGVWAYGRMGVGRRDVSVYGRIGGTAFLAGRQIGDLRERIFRNTPIENASQCMLGCKFGIKP
jgi:hypothetical protein